MQILAKKSSSVILFFIMLSGTDWAQTPSPSAPSSAPATPTPAAAPNIIVNPQGGGPNTTETTLDYIFNHKAGEGTAAAAAQGVANGLVDKYAALDKINNPASINPVTRQKFLTYLGLAEVPEEKIKEYFDHISKISEMVRNGDSFNAWKQLYLLGGDYPEVDAGISRELANRVETVWNNLRTNSGIEQRNKQLKDEIVTSDFNADLIAQELREQDEESRSHIGRTGSNPTDALVAANSGSNNTNTAIAATGKFLDNTKPSKGNVSGSMELTEQYLTGLENRAKIKINNLQQDHNTLVTEQDFAAYIDTLFKNHRYHQVIIAADFYRNLFNQSEYPVSMANEVTSALEINQSVSSSVEVFKYKASQGNYATATTMLQQAFVDNEFHPALQGLPRVQKEQVSEYMQKLDVLKNVIEARDFGRVEALNADILKIAKDFDTTKSMALIDGVKLESMLRLGKAKLLVQQGNVNDAMKEFQAAAQAWPGNPDLQKNATGFFTHEDVQDQASSEFDRLVADKNYRALYEKAMIFGPAVHGDAKREEQLKTALDKVQKAEMASEKANLLAMNGDVDGAWETAEAACKDWPEDLKLNKLYADLSGRASEFVSAINKARDAENKKAAGFSLTWYVNAHQISPNSQIANDGIDRLSKQILASGVSNSSPGIN